MIGDDNGNLPISSSLNLLHLLLDVIIFTPTKPLPYQQQTLVED